MSARVQVKVCGIRSYDDAQLALSEGAWALGFIFHPPSPRSIVPEEAAALIRRLPPETLTVGVFVDWALPDLNAVVADVGLRAVQLHGSEDLHYAEQVRSEEVWRAFRTGPEFRLEDLRSYPTRFRVLLDAYRPDVPGGTGERCDWAAARQAQAERPIILAGGLDPDNVESALDQVRPAAIDLSSGLERAPGVKDPLKVRRLFQAVRLWENRQEARRGGSDPRS